MGQKTAFSMKVVGCKVNQVEAGMLAAQMEQSGWHQVAAGESPDLVWVHTCTVTRRADRDSKRHITQAHKQYPQAAIAVSGCLAELEKQQLASLPGVVAVIDQAHRSQAAYLVQRAVTGSDSDCAPGMHISNLEVQGFFRSDGLGFTRNRSRAAIKIEDGCDGACTYCRVRLARGRPVSRPLPDILKEIQAFVRKGFQEIVITGVNIGCWQPGLAQLICATLQLPGRFRLRLSSLEPQHLSDDLIQALSQAGDRLCPHLHLCLQSGDDTILRAMRRTYTVGEFKDRVARLRQARPDMVLTGDIIVGFPGETRKAFENSCELVRICRMIRLHVFPFSARPGTEAASLPDQVLGREITLRARTLRDMGSKLTIDYCRQRAGQETTVLLEQRMGKNAWSGTTGTYDRAHILCEGSAGQLVRGRISGLAGEILLVN